MFEIGASLKEARLRQGLDFPEIETGTKIRGKYLNALEEERFDVLPAEAYIKGFLRTYAEYLGLDGQLYVDEFNSRYVAPEEMQSIRVRRTAQARRHRRVQGGVLIAALAGIAIVTALVIVAWTSGSAPNQHRRGHPAERIDAAEEAQAHAAAVGEGTHHAARGPHVCLAARGAQGWTDGQDPARERGARARRGEAASRGARCGSTPALRGTCALIVNGKRVTYPGGKPQAFVVSARGIIAPA